MAASLDLDQLRTFVAIAETGSFTRAGDYVLQDPVGGLDADAPPRGADRQADLRPRRPCLAPDRGGRAPARLRPPHGPPRRRDGRRLRRYRVERLDPPRHAGRLCRPFPARDSGALLALQPARRGLRHLRAVAGTDPPGQGGRRRSRHRHQLRRGAGRGHPPRAAALGRSAPSTVPPMSTSCRSPCRSRPACGATRRSQPSPGSGGSTASSTRAPTPLRSPPPSRLASR